VNCFPICARIANTLHQSATEKVAKCASFDRSPPLSLPKTRPSRGIYVGQPAGWLASRMAASQPARLSARRRGGCFFRCCGIPPTQPRGQTAGKRPGVRLAARPSSIDNGGKGRRLLAVVRKGDGPFEDPRRYVAIGGRDGLAEYRERRRAYTCPTCPRDIAGRQRRLCDARRAALPEARLLDRVYYTSAPSKAAGLGQKR
jgi:hypothetical protein